MKSLVKYLTAILIAGSIFIWFVPLIEIGAVQMSIMDIMKTGFGFYSVSGEKQLIYAIIQNSLSVWSWIIAAAALIVLLEAFFTAVPSGKAGFVVSLAGSILNLAGGIAGGIFLWNEAMQIKQSAVFLLTGETIKISFIPLAAWAGGCLIILFLSIIGLRLSSSHTKETDEIYLEELEGKSSETVSSISENPFLDSDETVAVNQSEEQEQETVQTSPSVYAAKDESFTGAVLGLSGHFMNKVFPLSDKTEVFFRKESDAIVITPFEAENNLAGLYYISSYNEYCIEPEETMTVFLESGQPLGKGRRYYLPRGIKIYIKSPENPFILA